MSLSDQASCKLLVGSTITKRVKKTFYQETPEFLSKQTTINSGLTLTTLERTTVIQQFITRNPLPSTLTSQFIPADHTFSISLIGISNMFRNPVIIASSQLSSHGDTLQKYLALTP
jgi:hypothetical protein